jgi:hypothetical protein
MKSRNFFLASLSPAILLFGCAPHIESGFAGGNTPYDYALTSPGSRFAALPPTVKNTVRAEAGAAEITDVETYYAPEGPVYTIHFRNAELFPPMLIAADGSLLHPDLSVAVGAPRDTFSVASSGPVTGVKLSELPPPVLNIINSHAAESQIAYINKETWGNRNVFIVSFIDPQHHPRLYVTADGKVLNEGPK